MLRAGINGFGRIGRIAFRAGHGKVDFVGINDMSKVEANAHLLKYDSTHGKAKFDVKTDGNFLVVDNKKIPTSNTKNPDEIPWANWEAEMVFE